jgi:monovalent cation:H+ antiporter-2, CPA2 family
VEHTAPAVFELGFLLLLAALAGRAARWIGLPAVIGYLAVGVAVSPFTPGYVANREQLSLLADIGVVLLLTWVISAAACVAFGVSFGGAAIIGLSVAMSSSVVIVNITRSRRRTTDAATDQMLLGWSVLQDLLGVTAALILLVILGIGGRSLGTAALQLLAFLVLAAAAAVAVPWALRRLKAEHDLFLLLSVGSGLLLAGLGSQFFGIPLALAAFVAGLAITESEVAGEARERMLPFRDVFAVMFFVSLGTLVDPNTFGAALPLTMVLIGLVIGAKVLPAWIAARFGRLTTRPLQLAIGLGQIGEFSYVLAAIALGAGLITLDAQSALIAAVVVTIAASSVLVRLFPKRVEAG